MARILVVEDNADVRDSMVALLQAHGHEIVEAVDGADGLEVLERDSAFDLIVSDNNMPNMNGIDLLKKVAENPRTKGIRFILQSGQMPSPEELEAVAIAGGLFYGKPNQITHIVGMALTMSRR